MSYTKDFLESKSQQYPEILKMTDEEALRYLDFMGELVESVESAESVESVESVAFCCFALKQNRFYRFYTGTPSL